MQYEPDDRTMRKEREGINNLSLRDSQEVLAVDGPANCATVYVAVDPQVPGVYRVDLVAELFGVRNLIASAFVEGGFMGPCINVTGFNVDGWHVEMRAAVEAANKMNVRAGIQAGRGCSGFAVIVPPSLLCPPGGTPAELLTPPPAPWTREAGLWNVHTNVTEGVDATLVAGERVHGITVFAAGVPGDPDATISISLCGGQQQIIEVPAGTSFSLDPNGNLEGPGTITFANFLAWTVQTVR